MGTVRNFQPLPTIWKDESDKLILPEWCDTSITKTCHLYIPVDICLTTVFYDINNSYWNKFTYRKVILNPMFMNHKPPGNSEASPVSPRVVEIEAASFLQEGQQQQAAQAAETIRVVFFTENPVGSRACRADFFMVKMLAHIPYQSHGSLWCMANSKNQGLIFLGSTYPGRVTKGSLVKVSY